MIGLLAFEGYRSLRSLCFELAPLTIVTGVNGAGKSNVYRALRLLVDAAEGRLGPMMAREGGLDSAMWAGGRGRRKPGGMGDRLGVGFADDVYAYELRLGLAGPPPSPPGSAPPAFFYDPFVKEETIRTVIAPRAVLLERRGTSAIVRDEDGRARTFPAQLDGAESVLAQLAEPHRYPVLSSLRERLRSWRFYHQLRTDADSPLRQIAVGSRTPVLAHDGHDLAPALLTILDRGDDIGLQDAVADALDGARLEVHNDGCRFELFLHLAGIARPLSAAELSDGMLRYLALLAALRSPRQPELLVLNEPETSLHPRVLPALARQIVTAATRSQVIVVSHAAPLVDALAATPGAARVELEKELGATQVRGRRATDAPAWKWTS